MPTSPSNKSDRAASQPSYTGNDPARLPSAELLRGNRRLIIEHQGEEYCLRVTRNERLILTKD